MLDFTHLRQQFRTMRAVYASDKASMPSSPEGLRSSSGRLHDMQTDHRLVHDIALVQERRHLLDLIDSRLRLLDHICNDFNNKSYEILG
jgi:hypothetical protein